MFPGMGNNPLESYRQVGQEANIRGSEPYHLVVLLLEGCLEAMRQAKLAIEAKDIERKGAMITKAIEIINDGLSASLNMEDGGSIAINLKALYDYVVSRLLHAHVNSDANAISESEELLGEILTAWREISPSKNPPRQADEQPSR